LQASWRLPDASGYGLFRTEIGRLVSIDDGSEVIIVSSDDLFQSKSTTTGAALVAAMQASPHREIDI
jgi:hypothetical protein